MTSMTEALRKVDNEPRRLRGTEQYRANSGLRSQGALKALISMMEPLKEARSTPPYGSTFPK
jgi:hypothetical protein